MTHDTILLIPNPEGSKLLDDPCAPTRFRNPAGQWEPRHALQNRVYSMHPGSDDETDGITRALCDGWPEALVLAESGKLQRHGCLTLAGAASAVVFAVVVAVVASVLVVPARAELLRAFAAEHYPGARLVFLADGVEVTP